MVFDCMIFHGGNLHGTNNLVLFQVNGKPFPQTFCFPWNSILFQLNQSNTCLVSTCMFPIKWAKRTSPKMAMRIANEVSPINVLVDKFCPYELQNLVKT